jgi:hypothetical protein
MMMRGLNVDSRYRPGTMCVTSIRVKTVRTCDVFLRLVKGMAINLDEFLVHSEDFVLYDILLVEAVG